MKWIFASLLFLGALCAQDRYPVDLIVVRYMSEHQNLPTIHEITDVKVTLGVTESGYVAPRDGLPSETVVIYQIGLDGSDMYYRSALVEISKQMVAYFNKRGIHGVSVHIDPREIGRDGRDLRSPGNQSITYLISTAKIGEMRTVAKGDLPHQDQINNRNHAHIKQRAPVGSDDLLASEELEDYVYYLNRHPNRRVDLEMGSVGSPGMTSVDFLINEDKSWRFYGNLSNTGPATIEEWQQVFGYVDTQFSNFDDVAVVDFATDTFNQYYSYLMSYDRPFKSFKRLRWNIEGSYRRFSSAQLGFGDRRFRGDFYELQYGLDWNFFQKKDFFADFLFNAQYNYISVNNKLTGVEGHQDFFIPQVGLRFSRLRPTSTFLLSTLYQSPINSITGVKRSNINRLGRWDVNKSWGIWTGSTFGSVYLEALFQGDDYKSLAHEFALSSQWQYAFNNRLIPEYESVVGGLYSIRGYRTAVIAGDSSIIGSAEYRLHIPQLLTPRPEPVHAKLFGKPFRVSPQYPGGRTDWDFIVRLFFDIGTVGVKQSGFEVITDDPEGMLMGTGFGGEFIFRQNLFIRGDFAWALKTVVNPTVQTVEAGNFEPYLSVTVVY